MRIHFTTSKGERIETEAQAGDNLLRVAQAAGLPLEGTCEGQMACSTCHVVIAPDWFDKLSNATEEEEDMLDLAAGVQRTSRLSCQIVLGEELDGISVTVPEESHDMRKV